MSNPATVTVHGPPGDYLLAVSATWDIPRPYDHERGEASYYIRIRVA